MNFYSIKPFNLRLFPRDEGKIKCYESCCDIRAWSHDCRTRNRYLRERIKGEMPICIIPGHTLACLLRIMTCKSRCKATPQCHPDCKSKVVLESICSSCHIMKECLKNEECFDKYFDDVSRKYHHIKEELETSHWPCERCLDALKSIKMFWKIIVDKIFNIKFPKKGDIDGTERNYSENVRSVARQWKNEMVEQARFIKSSTPVRRGMNGFSGKSKYISSVDDYQKCDIIPKNGNGRLKSFNMQATCPGSLSNLTKAQNRQMLNRQTSARINTVDIGCNCLSFHDINNEINDYKNQLSVLKEKLCKQSVELEKLRQENSSLKLDLQKLYNKSSWQSIFNAPIIIKREAVSIVPKPYEDNTCLDCSLKPIESEIIITMKKCKNESYRHISLLQVLHKSNKPLGNELDMESCLSGNKQNDPIQVLTKVQNTFGAIVRQEMYIASEKKQDKNFDINAAYYDVNTVKSNSDITSCCNSRFDFLSRTNSLESPSTQCGGNL